MPEILNYLKSSRFIISCVIFIVCVVICAILGKYKKKITQKIESLQDPKVVITRRLFLVIRVLVIAFGFLIICQINGVNLMSVIAGLGIASAVVGLALQDYLKDVIMGIHILSDKFFTVGECVEINGREGIVVSFNLTTTKLGDLNDRSITTICNRNITEVHRIRSRFVVDIPLSYDEDFERIHKLFGDNCERIQKIEDVKECRFLGTENFGESSILYRILILCDSTKKAAVRREVLYEIQKILDEENIVIPYNQLDVHFDKEEN